MSALHAFRPRAVIFDLDGTLADNMTWHAQAFDAFVRRHGLPEVTKAMRRRIDGKRNVEIMPLLFGRDATDEELQAWEDEKEGVYREMSRGQLRATAGADVLLDRLASHGIGVAVATSAPAGNVTHTLAELGLTARFPVIVRSDQVQRGKPAPDVYLEAARLLGADPAQCLAFEDAPVGVAAARSAGMHCLALTTTFSAEDFASAEWTPTGTVPNFSAYLTGDGQWLTGVTQD